ncbi:5,6-dimethylbenzimidazole synthase [Rhodobacter capsulatus]|uniref:5,6-dimethylbenzimidazole synthase n=1 Tax=Rhodobacter capsulatus TaxID=1061 RepID=A0A1G7I0J1_RHOCA|nr:5,6-dimethylbenzimidazole synthase [Rhodobacter capsulatus]WER11045.1 5,6-dimethylbenzimidazole synthase [Rhodobacter capsulatus]SDF06158.1 cob(II)yrinic acid a,c-diamide reductase /5,6-dimethylbenzimidazole synthase [Rhodobacter capsulatus]
MNFEQTHRDALTEVLRWRRDVRHFRPDPIAEEVIDRLRAVMDMAPSVGNARPWRVIRVESPAIRAEVLANFNAARAAAGQGYDGEQAEAYAKLKLQGIDQAPLQLAVFTHRDPQAGHGLGRASMPVTLQQSTAMAIHTLWLAARAENLGLGMVSVLDPKAVERLLDVPRDWDFVAWLCIGTPEFTDDTPLLHRAGWQENLPTEWELR